MEYRKLGKNGMQVSALGLGCMGMSFAYGPADDEESLRVLRRYLELGGNFLDTAEVYGPYKNEELLGRFLREVPRDRIVVATKFGFRFGPGRSPRRRQLAREYPPRGRRKPPSPGHRDDRPLLPASRRSQRADRRYGRGGGRTCLGRESPNDRIVGSRPGNAAARRESSSDCRTAKRVLALVARSRGQRRPRDLPRAGHHFRSVQPAGPRIP